MVKMKIKYLIQLIRYFIITEIISGIELIVLLHFKEFFISLINLENDVLGIRYIIPFLLIVIPIISSLAEYKSKQKKISEALNKFLKK